MSTRKPQRTTVGRSRASLAQATSPRLLRTCTRQLSPTRFIAHFWLLGACLGTDSEEGSLTNLKLTTTLWQSKIYVPRGKVRCCWIPSESHHLRKILWLTQRATRSGKQKMAADWPQVSLSSASVGRMCPRNVVPGKTGTNGTGVCSVLARVRAEKQDSPATPLNPVSLTC